MTKVQEQMALIKVIKRELLVSTLDIWESLQTEHRLLISLIREHLDDFRDIRPIQFEETKSGGRPTVFCYLDEEQVMFLISLMRNSDLVVKFKKKIVHEFCRMRRFIEGQALQRHNAEYIEIRKSGKIIRHSETDVVKDFIEYATAQGSTHAKMYYVNISKMQNKALFLLDQKYKNVRDLLDISQLMTVASADKIVLKALKEGMSQGKKYQDIYIDAKNNVETFSKIHGKSEVKIENKEVYQIAANG